MKGPQSAQILTLDPVRPHRKEPVLTSSAVASLPPCNLCPVVAAQGSYLEGHGDLVSRLVMGIVRVITWLIGFTNLSPHDPPSRAKDLRRKALLGARGLWCWISAPGLRV